MRPKATPQSLAGSMLSTFDPTTKKAARSIEQQSVQDEPVQTCCHPPINDNDIVVTETSDYEGPVPVGLNLTSRDTGTQRLIYRVHPDRAYGDTPLTQGVRARVVIGECYGSSIVWFEERELTLAIAVAEQGGKPILICQNDAGDLISIKHGFEPATATWWRYAHEADPREYREHCLRIVELL